MTDNPYEKPRSEEPSLRNFESKPQPTEQQRRTEALHAQLQITGDAAHHLERSLGDDPSPEAQPTKERLEFYRGREAEARSGLVGAPQEVAEPAGNSQETKPRKPSIPPEIRTIEVEGKLYVRRGVGGEFYHGKEALEIQPDMKASVKERATPEEIQKIQGHNQERLTDFVSKHPELKIDETTSPTLDKALELGIEEEGELAFLLSGKPEHLASSTPESLEKMGHVTEQLDKAGLLDSEQNNPSFLAVVIGEALKRIFDGQGLQYGEDGNVKLGADGLPEGLDNLDKFQRFQKIALSQVNITEKDGGADKYLADFGKGLNSRNTPWCAGFVNWCLKQAGYAGTNSLAAMSFINGTGLGHVGIKMEGKLLGGNQGDKVCLAGLGKNIAGYAIPSETGLKVQKGPVNADAIPNGAIIVYHRSASNRSQA